MYPVILFVLFLAMPALAQQPLPGSMPSATQTTQQQTPTIQTEKKDPQEERAKMFGLTKEDWTRYEELMKGPQAFQNPNADPVLVLGIYAKTDAERRKYAELMAHNLYRWEQSMWAFTRTYMVVQQKLYGHVPAFHPGVSPVFPGQYPELPGTQALAPFSGTFTVGDRITFFAEVNNCQECGSILTKLLDLIGKKPGLGLDIYVMDAGRDDKAIQRWAVEHQIPAKWVQNRTVTLNHEKGELFNIASTRTAPTTVLRRGGQFFDFTL